MKMSVRVTDKLTGITKKIQKELDKLPKKAYTVFKAETPIRTGNARRNTVLKGDTIEANYPYARRLDEGYSKQAPRGMVEPTQEFLEKEVQKIVKGSRNG